MPSMELIWLTKSSRSASWLELQKPDSTRRAAIVLEGEQSHVREGQREGDAGNTKKGDGSHHLEILSFKKDCPRT